MAVPGGSFELLRSAALAACLFLFPIGAIVLRKARRNAEGILRLGLNFVALAGVALAPFAAVLAVSMAIAMIEVSLAVADLVGTDDLRDIATGAGAALCAVLAVRLLLRRDGLVTLRLTR